MTVNWFVVWLICASYNEEVKRMSFGEFKARFAKEDES